MRKVLCVPALLVELGPVGWHLALASSCYSSVLCVKVHLSVTRQAQKELGIQEIGYRAPHPEAWPATASCFRRFDSDSARFNNMRPDRAN
jgi:hypothetical protein